MSKYLAIKIQILAILGIMFPVQFQWDLNPNNAQATPQSARFVSPYGLDRGDCSVAFAPCKTISYALDQAVSGDVLLIDCGTYAESLIVDKSISFANQYYDSQCVVITGSSTSRVFLITEPVTVSITDLVIANGFTTGSGGGIKIDDNDAVVLLNRVTIRNNTAGYGGGIYAFGSFTLLDSTIRDNTATVRGGGLHNFLRALTIQDSIIEHNSADFGAGLHNHSGRVEIVNSTLRYNDAHSQGGGISNNAGDIEIRNSTVENNTATSDGGGIYNGTGDLLITTSVIGGNASRSNGGGISLDRGDLILSESTLGGNSSAFLGGGIMSYQGVLTITQSTIFDNDAETSGGGLFNGGALTLINSTISGNSAAFGGGIHNFTGILEAINTTIVFNVASDSGAGIYNELSTTTIRNAIVAQNQGGGNCYNDGTFLALSVNLSSDTSCPGFSHTNMNPLLGPLQDHGGHTWTHLPEKQSPAVDTGAANICAQIGNFDQRGFRRINVDGNGDPGDGNRCDMGAVERGAMQRQDLFLPIAIK